MPDEGFSEVGGGGSVNWTVDVNNHDAIPAPPPKGNNPRGYNLKGTDRKGQIDVGKYFLVRIEDWTTIRIAKLGNDVVLAVPIKKKDGQIRVQWTYDLGELDAKYGPLSPMV